MVNRAPFKTIFMKHIDVDYIQRICNLTPDKSDFSRNITTFNYDKVNPFKKYYNINSIKGAIEKYLSKEWSDKTLAHWACAYCWILSGGCGKSVSNDLDSFEAFCRDFINWDLDGLSFYNAAFKDVDISAVLELFEAYDHIWNTRNEWSVFYAMIGPFAKDNDDQYALLVNDKRKEYMIMYSSHLGNGFEDERFKFVSQVKFSRGVERLKAEDYQILSCSEDFYYEALNDCR